MSGNEAWARRLAGLLLPGEKFRWELYSECLKESLDQSKPWYDLGCGHSDFIDELSSRVPLAVGVDLLHGSTPPGLFVAGRLETLPFRELSAGTLSLRFVLEHIADPGQLWRECRRVLAPGGILVVITTNSISPVVAVAGLLPDKFKRRLISRIFAVSRDDIYPTYHRCNSPGCLAVPPEGFELERIEFVEALDWSRKSVFLLQLALARLTRIKLLRRFRSNVMVVYRRTGETS
jgi:SAM-dependent methyltransferase